MKSVKPGRGPSAMGVWGAIVVSIGGIIWTCMAASMGAGAGFVIFGVLFVITGIVIGVYNFKNATGKNRYSAFDITDDNEEPDPLEQRYGEKQASPVDGGEHGGGFCPYCGTPVEPDHEYCRKCGKRI